MSASRATGVREADEARFSADSIDISGFELALDEVGPGRLKASYKVPELTVRDYAGPIHAQNAPSSGSLIDMYRFVLEQYAAVTASSLRAPTLAIAFDASGSGGGSGELVYSGVAMQKLGQGKIDAMKAERAAFTMNLPQPGKADKLTGEISDIVIKDFDSTAMAAALDPQKANDDSYHRVYGQMSTGTYVATSTLGLRMQIDGIAFTDIAVQPSKFRPAEIVALLSTDRSAVPTPAQSREIMEKVAGFYEGIRVGKIEIGTMSMTTPQGTPRLRAIRYQEGELALEGLDAPTPQGQFKMERFALKSFSVANLLHWAASLTNPGQRPSPDQMLGLFRVLAGAEIKGVVAPYKNTKKLVTIDTISLNWGQLVGSIPSKAHIGREDWLRRGIHPTRSMLPWIAADIDKLAIDLDLGAAWTELSEQLRAGAGDHSIWAIVAKAQASPRARQRAARHVLRSIRRRSWARRPRSRPARSSSRLRDSGGRRSRRGAVSRGCRMSAATPRADAIVGMHQGAGRDRSLPPISDAKTARGCNRELHRDARVRRSPSS